MESRLLPDFIPSRGRLSTVFCPNPMLTTMESPHGIDTLRQPPPQTRGRRSCGRAAAAPPEANRCPYPRPPPLRGRLRAGRLPGGTAGVTARMGGRQGPAGLSPGGVTQGAPRPDVPPIQPGVQTITLSAGSCLAVAGTGQYWRPAGVTVGSPPGTTPARRRAARAQRRRQVNRQHLTHEKKQTAAASWARTSAVAASTGEARARAARSGV